MKTTTKTAAKTVRKTAPKSAGKTAKKTAPNGAKKPALKTSKEATAKSAAPSSAKRVEAKFAELADWRGEMLRRLRAIVREADPDVVEELKWRDVPVWSHDGILCTGETYKSVVKMTFAKGAALPDPAKLFNSSLDGNVRRAIDFREGDRVDARALAALIRAAIALNTSKVKR